MFLVTVRQNMLWRTARKLKERSIQGKYEYPKAVTDAYEILIITSIYIGMTAC